MWSACLSHRAERSGAAEARIRADCNRGHPPSCVVLASLPDATGMSVSAPDSPGPLTGPYARIPSALWPHTGGLPGAAPGLSGMARRTLRTNLRFIGRRAAPQLHPADAPLSRERRKAPYSPEQLYHRYERGLEDPARRARPCPELRRSVDDGLPGRRRPPAQGTGLPRARGGHGPPVPVRQQPPRCSAGTPSPTCPGVCARCASLGRTSFGSRAGPRSPG